MLHKLNHSWQRCLKNTLTSLHTTLSISFCCIIFYANSPADNKEKEDINLQLQYHHLLLSAE